MNLLRGSFCYTNEAMNKIAENLSQFFSSLPFIIFNTLWFAVWIILHFTANFDPQWSNLTLMVSLEAIFLALFILRAENVQSKRTERLLRHEVRQEDKELKILEEIEIQNKK